MPNVAIIISDSLHPVYSVVSEWVKSQPSINVRLVNKVSELTEGGDFLFLVSCSELVNKSIRDKFKHCLVLHASDLPKGRGWSPHIWDIVNGEKSITLSLLEAEDKVDSGKVWLKKHIPLDGTELFDEINKKLFEAEVELIGKAIQQCESIVPVIQDLTVKSNYFIKRTPKDSEINPFETINSQFNLLRVCDPNRFPAYFYLNGQRYAIKIEKVDELDEK